MKYIFIKKGGTANGNKNLAPSTRIFLVCRARFFIFRDNGFAPFLLYEENFYNIVLL